MNETLDELLHKFICGRRNLKFYIDNLTDNVCDYYNLDELLDYGHYTVLDWEYNIEEQKLLITIEGATELI